MKKQASYILCILLLFSLIPIPTAHATVPLSESAVVIDFDTGEVLYNRNMNARLTPASLTKIMTAYILYEEIAAGNLTKDSLIPISPNAFYMNTVIDNRAPFSEGASYTVNTFLQLIFLPSSNSGTVAIAEYLSGTQEAFAERMNETAARLGLNAQYETAHGLWGNNEKTAHCVAVLIRHLIRNHPDVLQYSSLESFLFYDTEYFNINRLIFDSEEIDGFKTGATVAAGYCLATTAIRDGRRIIVVTMNASSRDAAFVDSQVLLEHGFAELEYRNMAVNLDLPDDIAAEEPEELVTSTLHPGIWIGALGGIVIAAGICIFAVISSIFKKRKDI